MIYCFEKHRVLLSSLWMQVSRITPWNYCMVLSRTDSLAVKGFRHVWRRISLRNRQVLAISTTKEAVYSEWIHHVKTLKRLRGNCLRQRWLNLLEHQGRTVAPLPSPPSPPPAIPINTECCFDCGEHQGEPVNWMRCWRCAPSAALSAAVLAVAV